MSKTLLIAKQEWKYLLRAPLAWTVLGVSLAVMAWIFLVHVENFQLIAHELMNNPRSKGVTGYVIFNLYSQVTIILMMIIPALAMNSIHREYIEGKMSLLNSAPISSKDIIFGKFIALALFLFVLVATASLMPLCLLLGAPIDITALAINALALWLLLCAFSSITLFLSSFSKEPVIALSLSIGVFLLLWLIDLNSSAAVSENSIGRYLSIMKHYENMIKTRINSSDFIYFILLITFFLILSIRRIDIERERV